jgi:hypothetical protein
MGAYGSVEKDPVAYGSGTWVRTHDAWVHWEGHDMISMLLIWMYGTRMPILNIQSGQEGTFLA